ncbi:hypothetical protein [Chitinophaga qingshengii]|uniref:Uncharacterized protein n=1 Tax=Chitinophaga qingshengii TaxID=1569794 RepID=A0ABR7TK42_9BACT|nr:hypothetical protein [Chitinophaga qingshengii]MBC9929862.1 hypothetical protein [Chitinophaga qingshengii]
MSAPEKQYPFFHDMIIRWFQGVLTTREMIAQLEAVTTPEPYEPGLTDPVSLFETALETYHAGYFYEWQDYKQYAKDTAPTVAGLTHQLTELLAGHQSLNEFMEWGAWHNMDGGETTGGIFENRNIEYFCLIFLPQHYRQLNTAFYEKATGIIARSNDIPYGAFVIALHLLLEKEYKSLYYFLTAYIEGHKTDAELNLYLEKKFSHPLPAFRYNISTFPYLDALHSARESKSSTTAFMQLMMI